MEKIRNQSDNQSQSAYGHKSTFRTGTADHGISDLEKIFPEWIELEKILKNFEGVGRKHTIGTSRFESQEFPLYAMSFGSTDPKAPVLALFAGVHGLERIGTQVVLSLMQTFAESLLWDQALQEMMQEMRILFVPIINPWGILNRTRCNPQGVDLMRNSPIDAEETPTWMVGGQRLSNKLPWYRGETLQGENKAVIDFCHEQFFQSEAVITLDVHSGFGLQDQIWFPYAGSKKTFPNLAEVVRLFENFERSHPHHVYKIEPQSLNYTTHGDLWDYLYQEFGKQSDKTYLPLCLEMGSWLWVKKNPLQIFSSLGAFNPVKQHRKKRTLRRHIPLFDYLLRATRSSKTWAELSPEQKNKYFQQGLEKWPRT